MLKFLDNRTHQKPAKSPKKYLPEMLYGISAQTPQTFQKPYTIVHKSTYINPYLKFQESRRNNLPKSDTFEPQWTKKVNLQMIEQQKISEHDFSNKAQVKDIADSQYMKSYYDQLNNNNGGRFRITRGQFTNFIQKNNRYKSIGPLHGQQRNQQRIQNTKKSVWLKPQLTRTSNLSSTNRFSLTKTSKKSVQYSTYFDNMRNSLTGDQQLVRTNTNTGNNCKLISEKTRIRYNRGLMNSTFEKQLFQRKKGSPHHQKFQLPKLQSEIVMPTNTFYKILPGQRPVYKDEYQGMENLDQFQGKLMRKFK